MPVSIERIERKGGVVWRVRWRDSRGRNRARVLGRKRDAEAFDAEVVRRKRTGELAAMEGGREALDEYVTSTWAHAHAAHLAPRTRQTYASTYDRHISPRLGGMRLNAIDAEAIAAFQGDLIRAGVGPHAIRKAMMLLGGILQRAAESNRIPFNPQRAVRKARLPRSEEVRPLPPSQVEAIRSVLPPRDNAIVSVLAYAGLRPGELRGLRWRHLGERTLLVDAEKTGARRNVRLLSPLRADLDDWRAASADPQPEGWIVPCGRRHAVVSQRVREVAEPSVQPSASQGRDRGYSAL